MHVYIMTNKKYGTLYTGVTGDLIARVYQHREHLLPGFTTTYRLKHLVYYGEIEDQFAAIAYEKKIKRWPRKWKFELIEKQNPNWDDLYPSLLG